MQFVDRSAVKPRSAVLAIAGPIEGDEVPLTNLSLGGQTARHEGRPTGIADVILLNDFEAQALAVLALGPEHMEKIGGGEIELNAGRVVLGPGTGLGVAGRRAS